MDTLLIAVLSAVLYMVAYHTYGKWLGGKIFGLNPAADVPSKVRNDGKDFVPSHRSVVFGHHFTSIAGTGPIVGPAIAVFWGWLPALIWVLVGSIFIGAVHDFAALVMSLRNQGRTIGDYCGDIVNWRVRILFLLIIFFALWIVLAIFGLVIAVIFSAYPQTVLPVWFQIPIAMALGYYVNRMKGNLLLGSIVAVVLMYITIIMAAKFPALQYVPEFKGISVIIFWTVPLMIYCFFASTMPVQTLLQPRDFINSHQLMLAMGLLFVGLLWAHPQLVAPAMDLGKGEGESGVPLWMPFLFITVACGACSGFHCLVSSGSSSKQLSSEGDAQYVGYGAMLLEGMLAVLVILTCTAGIGVGFQGVSGGEAWAAAYGVWPEGGGLGSILRPFIEGGANMITSLGIPRDVAVAILGVFVASFAATTLDSATRLQRYVISELGTTVKSESLQNRYVATGIAVSTGLLLACFDVFQAPSIKEGFATGGKGGLTLWPLFGATNQLLAGLALLVATIWLYRKQKPFWITAVPMVFMLTMTGWALTLQLGNFISGESPKLLLFAVGGIIMALQLWMVVEGFIFLLKLKGIKAKGKDLPQLVESA